MTRQAPCSALAAIALAMSLPLISGCGGSADTMKGHASDNAEPPPSFMRLGAVKREEAAADAIPQDKVVKPTTEGKPDPSGGKPPPNEKQHNRTDTGSTASDEKPSPSASPIVPVTPPHAKAGSGKNIEGATADNSGALTEDDVRVAVVQRQAVFRGCYDIGTRKAAGPGGFSGTVSLRVSIGGDGRVSSVEVQGSTTNSSDVDACVKSAILQIQFPARGSNAVVLFPIDFGR